MRPFLTAVWRYLAMLNYEIDPEILSPFVPAGTELDQFDGRTFISVVGFHFCDTRVLGVPIPLHRNFEEVNLRFYVRRKVGHEVRRGVVFIKEVVPRRMVAWIARFVYNENYHYCPMRHIHEGADSISRPNRVAYAWKASWRWHELSVTPHGEAQLPEEGTQGQFICEHYWGYTCQRNGSTTEYHVEHPPWRVWHVSDACLDCGIAEVYGKQFVHSLTVKSSSAFLAEGSKVVVYPGQLIGP